LPLPPPCNTLSYAVVDIKQPPRVVRRALERSADQGAVWDGAAYAILIRAEQRDPAMWSPPMWSSLGHVFTEALDHAYDVRKKGEDIPQPDLDKFHI
jgi:hypothetical protein